MANQITVQVYAIDNIPQRSALNVSFPTNQISAQLATSVLATNIQSQINYYPNPNNQAQLTEVLVSQSISDIATLASNSMFAASIYKINGYPQGSQALNMLFPSVQPSIWNVSGGGDVHSFVQFKGKKYYAHETSAALATAANAGDSGGGGIALESYQNSAMSAAVMAYVYRDQSNNIFGVYEPIRNNKVFRNQYAYADSIDLFPFDSIVCFNNILNDVKLSNFSGDILMQGNDLSKMIIDCNGHDDINISDNNWTGNYGNGATNGAEIFITGSDVYVQGNIANQGAYIDSIPSGNYFLKNVLLGSNPIDYNGFNSQPNSTINNNIFHQYAGLTLAESFLTDTFFAINYNTFFQGAYITIYGVSSSSLLLGGNSVGNGTSVTLKQNRIDSCVIGSYCQIDSTNGLLSKCDIASNSVFAPMSDQNSKNIINLGGTTYELGVTAGAVTATAV